MSLRNREDYNKYMREYLLQRYYIRRNEAIEKLGGCCKVCGSTVKLELDHIDPKTKSFGIGKMWSISKKRFDTEVAKCQLLCKPCHIDKTLTEKGFKKAKGFHGTVSSYRYCRCDLCKKAKAIEGKKYRKRKKAEKAKGIVAQLAAAPGL